MLVQGLSAVLGRIAQIEQTLEGLEPAREPVAAPNFAGALVEAEYTATPPLSPTPRSKPSGGPRDTRFSDMIAEAARKHGVDADLIHAVVRAESGYNPTSRSSAGAMGLMQLMPGTARSLGVRDAFDPAQNIDGGVRYLRQQLDKFGEVDLALAAYNAGPGAVQRHHGMPPYRETQAYVRRVLQTVWQRKGD